MIKSNCIITDSTDAKSVHIITSDGNSNYFYGHQVSQVVRSLNFDIRGNLQGNLELRADSGRLKKIIPCNQITQIIFEY